MRAVAKLGLRLLLLCLWHTWLPWRASSGPMMVASASRSASWKPVWSEEFDHTELDREKWTVLKENGCDPSSSCGFEPGQLEVSFNPTINPYVDADGRLVITAGNAGPNNGSASNGHSSSQGDADGGDDEIASTRLSTYGSADFLHGHVEVRAKVTRGGWGGSSGIWLMPSEERRPDRPSCARVNIVEMTTDVANSATASLNFGDEDVGCKSSDVWPHQGGGCILSPAQGVALSDDFHVYSLEWEESEFRWYLDGWHYCTKNMWFSKSADDYPAPFNKSFHLEMGVKLGGGGSGGPPPGDVDLSALPQEMLVDYVRITQGPTGSWWTPPAAVSSSLTSADEAINSSAFYAALLNALAVAACVLGPCMAMTGLSRPRANTILLGVEVGAFKAANAFYLMSDSYAASFAAAALFGMLVGYLAIRHRAMARWNTVAGLAIPSLFLLIDVGMISDLGSRYACWAIFFVLTITFSVLVFPSEHHALAFSVAAAAAGSCVLKLGVGWLMGEPGEIFKILDDPLGDRCHASRVCRSLTWVSGAMFLVGLCSQWRLAPALPKPTSSDGVGGNFDDTSTGLFTPPRAAGSLVPRVLKNPNPATLEEQAQAKEERQGLVRGHRRKGRKDAGSSYSRDAPTTRGGVWGRASASAKSMLGRVFRPFSPRKPIIGGSVRPDSPTPVPMPPACSNTMVSSQGDTIELIIHSPSKDARAHAAAAAAAATRSRSWGGEGVRVGVRREEFDVDGVDPTLRSSLGGGGGGGGGGGEGGVGGGGRRRPGTTTQAAGRSTLPVEDQDDSNDDDYGCGYDDGDALSVLSAVDLLEDPMESPSPRLTASLLDGHRMSFSHGSDGGSGGCSGGGRGGVGVGGGGGGNSSGRLADAFSERWGAWVRDASDSSGGGTSEQGREQRVPALGGRRARDFDDEALLLSPYDPNAVTAAPAAAAVAAAEVAPRAEATPPLTPAVGDTPPSSCSSTLAADDDDYWKTAGRANSMCNADASPASTAAGCHEDSDPSGRNDDARTVSEQQRRSEPSRSRTAAVPTTAASSGKHGYGPRGEAGAAGVGAGGAKSRAVSMTQSERLSPSSGYPDFDARMEAADTSRGKAGDLREERGSGYPSARQARRGDDRAARGDYRGGEGAGLDSGTDSGAGDDEEGAGAGAGAAAASAALRRSDNSAYWSTERSTGMLKEIDL